MSLIVCFGSVVSRRAFEIDGMRRKGTIWGCFLVLLSTAQPHEGLRGGRDPPDSSSVYIGCLACYLYYVFGQWDHPTPSSPAAWSENDRFGVEKGMFGAKKNLGGWPRAAPGPSNPSIVSVRRFWATSSADGLKLASGTCAIPVNLVVICYFETIWRLI